MSVSSAEITSPFAPSVLTGETPTASSATPGAALHTPFSEAVTDHQHAGETEQLAQALLAEFDDEDFEAAVNALADEAAARHLRGVATWSQESEAPVLATSETEQWMEGIAAETDRLLAELEEHFGDRPADSLVDGEMEASLDMGELEATGFVAPMDAQEQFFKSLVKKAKKVAKGVVKVARKGIRAVGKIALGRLFGLLRRLVWPLLRRVLDKAIGRLPRRLQPLARGLARKVTGEAETPADVELDEFDDDRTTRAFDEQLTELLLAPSAEAADQLLAGWEAEAGGDVGDTLHELDVARARLARELADAPPDEPPVAQMEQFIPAVMAAMPLIRAGINVYGRSKAINFVAGAIARIIRGKVGRPAARMLSRHIAEAGFKLLRLEAETGDDAALGAEALVATAEDTVRRVLALPPEALEDELLVDAEVQHAFAEAAAHHLPAAVLRAELVEGEDEHGFWIMMPRTARPAFRYKKYSRVVPVRIARPTAAALAMEDGETLEQRLLDAGVTSWPAEGEMEIYELDEGAQLGHIAAYETDVGNGRHVADAAAEFEELYTEVAGALTGDPRLGMPHRGPGARGGGRRGRRRYARLRVQGRPVRRRSPLGVRLDLSAPQPVLTVDMRVGERTAHTLAADLERRQLVQVVASVRSVLGPAARGALARRLTALFQRHGLRPPPGTGRTMADRLADQMVRAVATQLPAAGPALARAAQDPAPGVTLSFVFTLAGRGALMTSAPPAPSLSIRAGQQRG